MNENGEAYRNDNLVEEIGPDGTVKRIEHDARGLPVKVTDAADAVEALTLHPERDALGCLAMKRARGRSTLYRYDQLGQLLHAEIFSDDSQRRTVHEKLLFSYANGASCCPKRATWARCANSEYNKEVGHILDRLDEKAVRENWDYGRTQNELLNT